ncbi:flagellar hook-length control protein FliK [Pseudoroseicyclus aestuarii]|uniref:Flagellar hook-length control protein FliK n=2 Tax=Pseudoroseicyclus aestuarii TaxID=1795041 RepID=A0A318ST91_9RHOB|nr:flagellar hook-length control protein FliK [Pseudoroseicyclus aestuarii]
MADQGTGTEGPSIAADGSTPEGEQAETAGDRPSEAPAEVAESLPRPEGADPLPRHPLLRHDGQGDALPPRDRAGAARAVTAHPVEDAVTAARRSPSLNPIHAAEGAGRVQSDASPTLAGPASTGDPVAAPRPVDPAAAGSGTMPGAVAAAEGAVQARFDTKTPLHGMDGSDTGPRGVPAPPPGPTSAQGRSTQAGREGGGAATPAALMTESGEDAGRAGSPGAASAESGKPPRPLAAAQQIGPGQPTGTRAAKDRPTPQQATAGTPMPGTHSARPVEAGAEAPRPAASQAGAAGETTPGTSAPERRGAEGRTARRQAPTTAEAALLMRSTAASPAVAQPSLAAAKAEGFRNAVLPEATALPDPAAEPLEAGLLRPETAGMPRVDIAQAPRPEARPLAQQLSAALPQPEGTPTEIALDPEELGRVRMSLVTTGDSLTLVMQAERPETADLMRRHAAELAAELRDLGFGQVDLSFGGSARDRPDRGDGPTPDSARPAGEAPEGRTAQHPAGATSPPPGRGAATGLDLRL